VIVLDSSAAVEFLTGLEHGEWVERQLGAARRVHAPHVIDIEVANVFRRRVHQNELSARIAEQALEDLIEMPLRRYPHGSLLPGIWQLRENLSAFDAAFATLAALLELPLVTTDFRLARAPGLEIEIRTPDGNRQD
jgi:predicted nucleic acid-binding protein